VERLARGEKDRIGFAREAASVNSHCRQAVADRASEWASHVQRTNLELRIGNGMTKGVNKDAARRALETSRSKWERMCADSANVQRCTYRERGRSRFVVEAGVRHREARPEYKRV
jgi:hypothetical protein